MTKAIFLGSFNPPHIGHLNCIKSIIESGIMEKLDINRIHIIPCYQNPNKNKFQTSYIARYKMCEMMFKDLIISKKVLIDDIENELRPEYTYDLIGYFHRGNDKMIGKDFWWIITEETLRELLDGKWKNSEELLYDNNFIVLYESEGEKLALYEDYNMRSLCTEYVKINNPVNYHSTQLREKVKNRKSIVNETNIDIQEFIDENKIYK